MLVRSERHTLWGGELQAGVRCFSALRYASQVSRLGRIRGSAPSSSRLGPGQSGLGGCRPVLSTAHPDRPRAALRARARLQGAAHAAVAADDGPTCATCAGCTNVQGTPPNGVMLRSGGVQPSRRLMLHEMCESVACTSQCTASVLPVRHVLLSAPAHARACRRQSSPDASRQSASVASHRAPPSWPWPSPPPSSSPSPSPLLASSLLGEHDSGRARAARAISCVEVKAEKGRRPKRTEGRRPEGSCKT